MTRVLLHTFGCKANQYDTEMLRQALEVAGAEIVGRAADADAAVVNSCTVTHVGESKLRGFVRRLARARPGLRTIVVGCAAALDDGRLAELPGVAAVLGGAEPAPVLRTLGLPGVEPSSAGLRTFQRGARAWLKIQDGCDEHCTFCATTLARGASRSRRPADLVVEATALAAVHREIVLTGVHIGRYGTDLTPDCSLGTLVETLVHRVPDVRFRLSSVEATEVDERLTAIMAEAPDRLAPHLHAPLQSGSDRVLKRMGRHWYSVTEYRRRIEMLAARMLPLGLGADVMVGFPGETAADFSATRALIESLPFTYLHVFAYSERRGTAAARLGGQVVPASARQWSAELRAIAEEKGSAYRAGRVGDLADIVTLGHAAGQYDGLTGDYLTVRWRTDRPAPSRFRALLASGAGNELSVGQGEQAA
jgi:threonylcarbamoyladenosine tRNA methylthiotransferase MtaB